MAEPRPIRPLVRLLLSMSSWLQAAKRGVGHQHHLRAQRHLDGRQATRDKGAGQGDGMGQILDDHHRHHGCEAQDRGKARLGRARLPIARQRFVPEKMVAPASAGPTAARKQENRSRPTPE